MPASHFDVNSMTGRPKFIVRHSTYTKQSYSNSLLYYLMSVTDIDYSSLFDECQKRPNLHTNELNTTFFCSTSPLKAPNRLKPLKLA
jgi:hypothetical protein